MIKKKGRQFNIKKKQYFQIKNISKISKRKRQKTKKSPPPFSAPVDGKAEELSLQPAAKGGRRHARQRRRRLGKLRRRRTAGGREGRRRSRTAGGRVGRCRRGVGRRRRRVGRCRRGVARRRWGRGRLYVTAERARPWQKA